MGHQRLSSLSSLSEPFRSAIVWLRHRLDEKNIPVLLWETGRTPQRQRFLYKNGSSQSEPGESAHEFGFAADFVIDSERCETGRMVWSSEGGSSRWVPFHFDCQSPQAVATWRRFGAEVERCGLAWGGNWRPLSRDGIGWAYTHVEMAGWRTYRPTSGKITKKQDAELTLCEKTILLGT